ncbi:isoleucine--tRNA ligase [Sandaracinobacter sp. RS1-74]|uniref:isoleucine--tRNA ligase n=1 Tax=Sandaracinobacteroides sayramensis TaxID=2913411 RepID=UPI001EDC70A1|nr:isoleucine--tRNA ligase [Sandaracinobacteroides sayramensis]MCG2839985.1 isoleucine--tRNA ligase [Sandaracinobacteroides sayramensis]
MTESKKAADYRHTVFLPETGFPMKAGLAQTEPRLLERWAAEGAHEKLRALRTGAPRWILHDGPPYANGDMHLGHAMNHILKDFVVRTRSMLGFDSPYIPGWDCHGLPIEWRVEELNREKGIRKGDIEPMAFRQQCRDYAAHWVNVQRAQLKRLGVWGDWDNPYLTMDFSSEATIASELMKFAESGQLYRGAKPVMWSPVEQTALAEAEVEYEEITSTQVDVAFEIMEAPNAPELVGAYVVIWTTTPWTLPVNRALAYGEDVDYSLLKLFDEQMGGLGEYLVATSLVDAFLKRIGRDGALIWQGKGSALAGAIARHPWHPLGGFFAEPRPLLPGEFVTTDAGTGLVHMAPDHGEDDFHLCKAHGIDPKFVVGPDGTYQADWPVVGGQHVYKVNDPDGPICSALREAGALLAATTDYRHSYPHSWRSKKKLIYRCTPQWFVAMDRNLSDGSTLRGRALKAIGETKWFPSQGENRIRAMVEGRPDWVLSRQRAWGVPITLFVKKGTGDYLRDRQVNERIAEAIAREGADAWWTRDPQSLLGNAYDAGDYEQVTDILDVWFDSGSTHAFVTEARLHAEQADLYLEGSDQHRGWFQSSLLESCGTRGRAPYKAVLTHGFALDERGRKMSKSLGNVIDPLKLIDDSGADVLRLWCASVDFVEDVRLGKAMLQTAIDSYRKLRNTLRYLLGALNGHAQEDSVPAAEMPELERYILSRLAALDMELRAALEVHGYNRYISALIGFVNSDLSAFFFDVRKDSLYCDGPYSSRRRAYRTVLAKLFDALNAWLAPVLVFTTEEAHEHRHGAGGSVHFGTYATIPAEWRDEALEARFDRLRELRALVTQAIEPMRREKQVGSSNEVAVRLHLPAEDAALVRSVDFAEFCIVSAVEVLEGADEPHVETWASADARCARCWRHLPDVSPESDLCARCDEVVLEHDA